ncbi:MAG: metallophosphoesterase [Candidatus Woesearchaeota archaeon]|nr:metallophosphoesterase [Candidatus Woesearchaeota archaeon]
MKLLVIGDFQGVFPAKLKRKLKKEAFDAVIALGDYAGIEAWNPYLLYALRCFKDGDFPPSAKEFFGKKKYKQLRKKDQEGAARVFRELNALGKPVFFIFGNHDNDWHKHPYSRRTPLKKNTTFLKKCKNLLSINYRTRVYNGIRLLGFGGHMDVDTNTGREARTRKARARKKLFSLFTPNRETIFVVHYPPKGVFDVIKNKKNPFNRTSVGVRAFTAAIKRFKPNVVLCGHMHEYQGKKKLHGVPVINPGSADEGKYAILEYPSLRVRFEH